MPESDQGEMRSDVRRLQSDVTDIKTTQGEMRSDVRHLQSDVTDIKAEQRITNQRVDSLMERVNEIKDSLSSAKVWAIGLYAGLAGTLLLVIAHGFKWI